MKTNQYSFTGILLLLFFMVTFAGVINSWAEDGSLKDAVTYNFEVEEILSRVETRYKESSFSADFLQESTLKAIDVTDTAKGRAHFKRPSKMKWEYTEPMQQLYISDGTTLWVYSPTENQVMIGGHPAELDFLSDLGVVRDRYTILVSGENERGDTILSLSPRENNDGVPDIKLTIEKSTFRITEIVTTNINDDETKITFSNFKFDEQLADDFFKFIIPPGTDEIR